MTAPEHPWDDGAEVRAKTRKSVEDEGLEGDQAKPGNTYKVFTYVPAGHQHNEDPQKRAYYLVDDEYSIGGSHWAFADDLELVRTAEQLAARKLPSLLAVSKVVASGMHSAFGSDDMEFDETSVEGPDDAPYVYAYGRTDEGLPISVKVAVIEVFEGDF